MRRCTLTVAVLLAAVLSATLARAQPGDEERYTIMVPEKGSKPPKPAKPHRGSSVIVEPAPLPPPLHYVPPDVAPVVNYPPAIPPAVVAPSGQVLPNIPPVIGAGPGGAETYQDRASRCAYQAGVYGNATGNPTAYLGACVNQ